MKIDSFFTSVVGFYGATILVVEAFAQEKHYGRLYKARPLFGSFDGADNLLNKIEGSSIGAVPPLPSGVLSEVVEKVPYDPTIAVKPAATVMGKLKEYAVAPAAGVSLPTVEFPSLEMPPLLRGNNMMVSLVFLEVLVLILCGNFAVEKYADWKTAEMAKIVLEETSSHDNESTIHHEKSPPPQVWQPSQLRSTIHPRSGLVENLNHRRAWNRWLMATSLSSPDDTIEFLNPGEYAFAYRSYANYEEAGAIRKRLYHLPTLFWGYVQPTPGIITISAPPESDTTGNKPVDTPEQKVTNEEVVRFGWFTLSCIQWSGHWDPKTCSIQWTDSKLTIHRRNLMLFHQWWKYWRPVSLAETQNDNNDMSITTEVVSRPERSEELRKIPWQVIKEEDGMIAFRRGDVGMLVYDKNAKVK